MIEGELERAREERARLLQAVLIADRSAAAAAAVRLQLIDRLRRADERETELAAAEVAALAGPDRIRVAATRGMAARALRAELALALRIPEGTADGMITRAERFAADDELVAALRGGGVSERHLTVLMDELDGVDDPRRRVLQTRAIETAKRVTVAELRRRLRRWRDGSVPLSLQQRHDRALERRAVWVTEARDGMASLEAILPAVEAFAIHDRLTRVAAACQDADDGRRRTRDQARADALCDLLLDGEIPAAPDAARGIRAEVAVTVPALTLAGAVPTAVAAAGELDGCVPIDPATARRLAGESHGLTRILTHPETGAVVSIGRDRYRPPEHLRRALRLRDGCCRFPGCRRAARRADLDHTRAWADGGDTAAANLAALCPGHHALKHGSDWAVRHSKRGDGTLVWTSPLGLDYRSRPRHPVAPVPVAPPAVPPPDDSPPPF